VHLAGCGEAVSGRRWVDARQRLQFGRSYCSCVLAVESNPRNGGYRHMVAWLPMRSVAVRAEGIVAGGEVQGRLRLASRCKALDLLAL